jgi:two-component system CheB/CheR fusion protein
VLLRWLLDPMMGDTLPLVTLFGAVGIAVWAGGYAPALLVVVVGYLACDYLFIEPRGRFSFESRTLVGLYAYLFTCSLIIGFGEALRAARRRAETGRESLRTTLASIGDAVIATDVDRRITSMNPVAEALTGWSSDLANGQPLDAVFRVLDEDPAVLATKDGRETPIDHSAAPIRDRDGAVVGSVLVFRDVTERRAAEKALRESEARKSAMVSSALDCIISIDHEGRILEFNPAAEQTFGYRRSQALGREMAELIIPPALRESHRRGLARHLKTGEASVLDRRLELTAARADGTEFAVELAITRPSRDEPPTFTGYLRDVSERRRTESRRAVRLAVTQVLAGASGLREMIPQLVQAIGGNLGWEVGAFWQPDDDAGALRCVEFWHAPAAQVAEFEAITRQRSFERGIGLPGRIWASGKPAWIPDVTKDDNFPRAPIAIREGLHGAFGFPVTLGAQFLGVIEFFSREIQEPDADLLEMMSTIGGQVGQFIDRRQAEERLREGEERYRSLTQAITSVVWTTDPEGRFVTPQPSWSEFTGQRFEESRDFGWVDALHPDDRERLRKLWDAARASKTLYESEGRLWHAASGSYRHFEARGVPILATDGSVKEWVGKCLDVEDRKRAEEGLKEANRRKDEFLAMLAHELRNPLFPIRNAVHILRHAGSSPEAIRSTAEMLERQVGQMVRLVDDLLDVSRITREKIELRRERTELVSVVNQAVEAARSMIQSCEHELTITLPPQSIYLDADPARLAQVVGNLLHNASKFMDKGGRIELAVERDHEQAIIRIQDRGIGIAAHQLPRIFEMFVQVDTSLERPVSGLGLGLTLVKNLVEMHGGTVEAHSDGLGKGSEFVVRLPLSGTPAPPSVRPARAQMRTMPRRILIVDDNQDGAQSLAALLALGGHLTQVARDGLEAIEAAQMFRPDVMLLDIGLPKLNGYEVCRRIRQMPWGKAMLLVAVTGWGQEGDRERSKSAGFDAHLVKPVDHDVLKQLLAASRSGP